MTCTFKNFDKNLFSNFRGIPYKYVVHSPRTEKPADWYEYLHAFPDDHNRCLVITPTLGKDSLHN